MQNSGILEGTVVVWIRIPGILNLHHIAAVVVVANFVNFEAGTLIIHSYERMREPVQKIVLVAGFGAVLVEPQSHIAISVVVCSAEVVRGVRNEPGAAE